MNKSKYKRKLGENKVNYSIKEEKQWIKGVLKEIDKKKKNEK